MRRGIIISVQGAVAGQESCCVGNCIEYMDIDAQNDKNKLDTEGKSNEEVLLNTRAKTDY